ncbi:MAG: hypothetical protein M3162_09230 [Thermoproteota archaeon]|nr:hypothetical protein [Thermoproteota archaeon]
MYNDDIFFNLKNSIYNTPLVKSILLLSNNTNLEEQLRINKLVADQFPDKNLIDDKEVLSDLIEEQKNAFMEALRKINSLSAKENDYKERIESLPKNASIREEFIKCGKDECNSCPHGPYYYAYWKDKINGNNKLKKKYLGNAIGNICLENI